MNERDEPDVKEYTQESIDIHPDAKKDIINMLDFSGSNGEGKRSIAVFDLDNTIIDQRTATPMEGMMEVVRACKRNDLLVVIITARPDDRFNDNATEITSLSELKTGGDRVRSQNRDWTLDEIKKAGIPVETENVYLQFTDAFPYGEEESTVFFKKATRDFVKEFHKDRDLGITFLFGDNCWDLTSSDSVGNIDLNDIQSQKNKCVVIRTNDKVMVKLPTQ